MRIRVIELCSYGKLADFEAIDFDGVRLNLDYIPEGWTPKGGNNEARKLLKDEATLTVYVEGRIIGGDLSSSHGRNLLKNILESWPRLE